MSGSAVPTTEKMWVFDKESSKIVNREITFTPGLYKIFDEILVNAADNKQRDPKKMDTIKIDINPEKNEIKVGDWFWPQFLRSFVFHPFILLLGVQQRQGDSRSDA